MCFVWNSEEQSGFGFHNRDGVRLLRGTRRSLNIRHSTLSVEGVMLGRNYVKADEKQVTFDDVISVGTLNIDTVLTGKTSLKFANINLC